MRKYAIDVEIAQAIVKKGCSVWGKSLMHTKSSLVVFKSGSFLVCSMKKRHVIKAWYGQYFLAVRLKKI